MWSCYPSGNESISHQTGNGKSSSSKVPLLGICDILVPRRVMVCLWSCKVGGFATSWGGRLVETQIFFSLLWVKVSYFANSGFIPQHYYMPGSCSISNEMAGQICSALRQFSQWGLVPEECGCGTGMGRKSYLYPGCQQGAGHCGWFPCPQLFSFGLTFWITTVMK